MSTTTLDPPVVRQGVGNLHQAHSPFGSAPTAQTSPPTPSSARRPAVAERATQVVRVVVGALLSDDMSRRLAGSSQYQRARLDAVSQLPGAR